MENVNTVVESTSLMYDVASLVITLLFAYIGLKIKEYIDNNKTINELGMKDKANESIKETLNNIEAKTKEEVKTLLNKDNKHIEK